jgi:hypothetical protein
MKKITLSIDEDTLKAGRNNAKRHKMSLNALIRKLLEQNVIGTSTQWLIEAFKLMDRAGLTRAARSGSERSFTVSKIFLETNVLL